MPGKAGSIRSGGAYVEIFGEDGPLRRTLANVRRRLDRFSASTARIGGTITAAAGAAIAPMLGATQAFASTGDALQKMSGRTGFSVEALSELSFAADQSGTSLATVEGGVRRMQRVISDSTKGMASATTALEGIGLSAKKLDGLSPEDQFALIAEQLSKVDDATRRAALAQELFGRAGTQMLPMFANGAAGIEKMRQQARELGLTMSTFDANQAARLTDAIDVASKTIKRSVVAVGAALAPMAISIAETIGRILSRLSGWIDRNRELVTGAAALAAGVALAGTAILGVAVAVKVAAFVVGALSIALGALGAVITGIGAVVGAMLSPIGLVVAAVALLGITFEQQTGLISKSIARITDRFDNLKTDAVAAFGGIKDAIAAGDISAAWAIVVAGLQLTWSMSMDALRAGWSTFVSGMAAKWLDGTASLRAGWALFTSFIEDKFKASMTYVLSLLKAAQNATARKLIELNPTLTVEQKNEQLQTLDEDQQRAAAADLSGADKDREARQQALNDRLLKIEQEYQDSLAALRDAPENDNESDATRAAREQLQTAIAAAAAARKAADAKTAAQKSSAANENPETTENNGEKKTPATTASGNRDRTFFSANVARRQAAFVSQPAGPVAEQDRLRTKVDQTAESVKNSGREFKRWSQTAAVAAAAVSAAMNPSIVAADVPTVDDQTQAITQQIVAADVPSVDDQTQAITQQIVAADVPTASDQIASVQQRAYPADTRELIRAAKAANYQATVQQDVVAADMPTVDDQIATVQQRAYPADVRELIRAAKSGDYQATVQQDVIAADVPTVSDQTHAITQQLVTADIPTVSDQTQAITQQLVTADMPTVSDQTQAITQQIVAADMPTVSDQTQAVTQQLVAADVPSVDDQTQAITQQIVAADVPALPKLTQQITQQISQEIIDAAPVDSEPLSRRDAYLKRQGRDAPDNSEPLSRRAAYLAQRGRDVPAVKPTNDTVAQTPPLSRRAAYLKSKLFAPTKTAGLSDEQLARIDQFKTQRANIADSQTQRPTKPREDDGIGRAIAIARQQSELMKQGIGAVVATNQGALAEILKFAEANQKFTDRVNGSTRVPDSIDSDSTMIEVRRQIALQLPSIRAEITRPEAPGATPGSRQPDRQLPVLQQMALTLQRIERKPPGVGTFGS